LTGPLSGLSQLAGSAAIRPFGTYVTSPLSARRRDHVYYLEPPGGGDSVTDLLKARSGRRLPRPVGDPMDCYAAVPGRLVTARARPISDVIPPSGAVASSQRPSTSPVPPPRNAVPGGEDSRADHLGRL